LQLTAGLFYNYAKRELSAVCIGFKGYSYPKTTPSLKIKHREG
jgi:hypothetical protein